MKTPRSFTGGLEAAIDRRLENAAQRVKGLRSELVARNAAFGGPGGGDDYELGGVSSLAVPGCAPLDGDVILAGADGLETASAGQTIQVAPPRLRHFANPRTPLSSSPLASLVLHRIYLHPLELAGAMEITALYLRVERDGNPDDNVPMLECALYKRNASEDGFTREAHFGSLRYADLAALGGGVQCMQLASAVLVPAGQHFVAVLYKYMGADGYRLGSCSASGACFPGAGFYRDGVALDLPLTLLDADLSTPAGALVWLELSGE